MKYFKNNLALKLFSIGLALLLWLIVFNVSNPEQKGSRTVELNILNRDAFSADNKTWEIDRNTVTVSYTVRSNMASSVQASDFNAYIDLKDYSITGAVPVYVELKNSENSSVIQDIVAKPSVVRVSVEDLQIKKFTLTTNRKGWICCFVHSYGTGDHLCYRAGVLHRKNFLYRDFDQCRRFKRKYQRKRRGGFL